MFFGIVFFLFLFIPILASPAHGQWAYTYGGTDWDYTSSVQQTADGGYIVAGGTQPIGTSKTDAWILKLDSNGSVSWQKSYGNFNADYAYSIQQTSDGGYIVAGFTILNTLDMWVMKLTGDGNVLWQKVYGGSQADYAYSIQQTSDGGFIVAGYTRSFGAGNYDPWLLKLDGNGNVIWQKAYGTAGNEWAYSVRQLTGGGYIVAGETDVSGNRDAWILKLDENGFIIWQKTYGGTGDDSARSIYETQDGGCIVAGRTQSFGAGSNDVWLLKLDGNGNVIWQKAYGDTGSDSAYSVQKTQDGGFIVAGETASFGTGNTDYWVIKLDENGVITWQKTFGGAGYESPRSIQQTQDGGYIVAGGTDSFGAGSYYAWVLKLDSSGSIGFCPFEGISTASVTDTAATVIDTTVSPVTSTATVTDTTATVTDTTISPVSVCGLSSGPERLKIGATRKKQGDGTITSLDNLIDCPDACESQYNTGITTILFATPSALSTFLGWKPASLGCEGTNPVCQVTMDKKKSVKAVFQGPNTLKVRTTFKKGGTGTVTSGGSLINCPSDCEELYTIGDSVTLTATPTQGNFVGWTGKPCKNELSNVCSFTMDKSYTVKAIFQGSP
jgi:hypothetical protein